jgi:hypothetical protein
MNRRSLYRLILIGLCVVGAMSRMEAAPQSELALVATATAVMSQTTARIGDRLVVTVTLERHAPSEARLNIAPPLGDFELVAIEHAAPGVRNGALIDEWRLTLVTFRPGRLTLPPISVEAVFGDGRNVVAAANQIEVDITAPEVTAATPLRPLATAPAPVPRPPWRRMLLVGASVALLAGGIVVLAAHVVQRLARRRQRAAYWRALTHAIERITGAPWDTWPRARRSYTQLSVLLRRGTARATALPIEHMPRRDMLRHVSAASSTGADLPSHVQRTLSGLDAARFARHPPDSRIHDGLIQNVQILLGTIRRVAHRNRR